MEIIWDSTRGMIGLPNFFGLGFEPDLVTCFVLATECLTMNLARDFGSNLVCSFPCIMLMQSLIFSYLLVTGILSNGS